MELAPGTPIGKYRLLAFLGAGAMGQVWVAEDTQVVTRAVALKLIPTDAEDPQQLRDSLVQEARAMVAIPLHQNVVGLLDVVDTGELLALVMEFVPGRPLRALLDRYPGGLPWRLAYPVAQGLLEGLAHAHAHGVVHRDLKPDNVLTRGAEEPDSSADLKILDFGLARLRHGLVGTEGEVGGTLPYMSPEQFEGTRQGPASDQYNLAVMLYELLTGRAPFRPAMEGRPVHTAYALAHRDQAPPDPRTFRPELPAGLSAILLKALAKAPADRHPTAEAFGHVLLPELAFLAQWDHPAANGQALNDVEVPFLASFRQAAAPPAGPEDPGAHAHATQPVGAPGPLPQAPGTGPLPVPDPVLSRFSTVPSHLASPPHAGALSPGKDTLNRLLDHLARARTDASAWWASLGPDLARCTGAETVSLAWKPGNQGLELQGLHPGGEARPQLSRTLLKEALRDARPQVLPDASATPLLDSRADLGPTLVLPLGPPSAPRALLILQKAPGQSPFPPEALALAIGVADLASLVPGREWNPES